MVKLAWRRGDYVGVRIERVGKVAPSRAKQVAQLPPAVEIAVEAPPNTDEPGGVGIPSRRRTPSIF